MNLSEKQIKQSKEFFEEHICTLKKDKREKTWCFTPIAGIGQIVLVKCSCGKHKDITDISTW